MKNKLLLISLLGLFSCNSDKQEPVVLTEATYVVIYTEKFVDTLNISTTGIIKTSSYQGVNELYVIDDSKKEWYKTYYRGTAPFLRIKHQETVIK